MKIDDMLTQAEIDDASRKMAAWPRERFAEVADDLRIAASLIEHAGEETDGRKRVDAVWSAMERVESLSAKLGGA